MRLLGKVIFIALVGVVLGDLTCDTYLPHNWTTKYARLNIYDPGGDGVGAKPVTTIPANASATNPFSIAKKSDHGDTFYFKICQSNSLNLHSSYSMSPSYCSASRKARSIVEARQNPDCSYLCEYTWNYFIQIIHNGTGHCLSTQHLNTSTSMLDFKPCNTDPKDTTQMFGATRIEYYNNNYGLIGPVCDWAPQILLAPIPNGSKYNYLGWDLGPDNKTLIRTSSSPRDILMSGLAIDPLTTYSKNSN